MKRLSLLAALGLAACGGTVSSEATPAESVGASDPFALDAVEIARANAADAAGRHVVVLASHSIPSSIAARVASLGGTIERAYDELGVVTVRGLSPEAAQALGPDVQSITFDRAIRFLQAAESESKPERDPRTAKAFARQWHLNAIGVEQAWAAGHHGKPSIRVAVLDTGIDPTHPDLVGRVDLARSKSFVPSDDALVGSRFPSAHLVTDLHVHGTHVAATIASNGKLAAGVTSEVTLIGVKVLGATGYGSFAGILSGIVHAADAGAHVINMSLGATFPRAGYEPLMAAIGRAVEYAEKKGALVVVAAGNDALDLDADAASYHAFCDVPGVLCVSATGPTSGSTFGPFVSVDASAPYTNHGAAVDLAAPGGAAQPVWAACSTTSLNVPICRTGHFIVGLSGTSMAAPHVSGAAALAASNGPKKPAQVRERLTSTALDLGAKGRDGWYGHGRLDVSRLLVSE